MTDICIIYCGTAMAPHWWGVNVMSGNGFVPSGSKPLPNPASIATLAQRRHWSASSRSAADVAPTLVFRRLRYYGMLAFCRRATVGVSLFADVLCLDIGGWKSSVSRINVVAQPDYRYINYIFRHHDQKNYYTSNLNKMYHFAASILFYDIAQLRFPPKAIWV